MIFLLKTVLFVDSFEIVREISTKLNSIFLLVREKIRSREFGVIPII